jgi:hypothetical protein
MKNFKSLSILIVLAMLFVAVMPAYAQLGETDISSFTVQNVDTTTATVTIHFYDEDGVETTPAELNKSQTNPFDLDPGESFEIYLPGIPDTELADGRYSVVIESSAKVVTIANLVGQGSINFNGSYSGFDAGASPFYLPAIVYNYYGWYSLISVQNVGTDAADITVTITCNDGTVGTLTATDVPVNTSYHFELKDPAFLPTGFTSSTKCNGSALVEADQDIVAVDNQSVPSGGNTQSYSGVAAGDPVIYVPALYNSYYGWNGSINIRMLGSADTTVTTTYSDSGSSECDLTAAAPSCLLYMPTEHAGHGYFGATITSDTNAELVVVVNAANGAQAQTYNGVGGGSGAVGIPSVMKAYYGWNTSFTCQNVGTVATALTISYDGFTSDEYDTTSLAAGETVEVFQPNETFLPNGHVGGATVTAVASGAEIACIVNFNNAGQMGSTVGDWSMSYNAFNK